MGLSVSLTLACTYHIHCRECLHPAAGNKASYQIFSASIQVEPSKAEQPLPDPGLRDEFTCTSPRTGWPPSRRTEIPLEQQRECILMPGGSWLFYQLFCECYSNPYVPGYLYSQTPVTL